MIHRVSILCLVAACKTPRMNPPQGEATYLFCMCIFAPPGCPNLGGTCFSLRIDSKSLLL